MGKRDKGLGRHPGIGNLTPHSCITLHILANILNSTQAFLPYLFAAMVTCSCADLTAMDSASCEITVTKAGNAEVGTLDLFFFNTDDEARLDAYQRFDGIGESMMVTGSSRTGKKTVVGVCNLHERDYSWTDICSLGAMGKMKAYLDEDDPARPVMSAETTITAGSQGTCGMTFRPLMSEVILRSVRCDFSGRTYRDERLEDVRVYLTNVCSSFPVLSDDAAHGSSDYINIGRADTASFARMDHPEYIYRNLETSIGSETLRADVHLFCYPNTPMEESLGSPFTRLVIEGTIQGRRYYYPINVNRREDGRGVERNMTYVIDAVITRRGVTAPDTAVDTGMAEISISVESWDEKTQQNVIY